KIKKTGKKINVWTIDDTTKFKQLKELGIDGFITDYPNIIR
ncbi:MAG TPA: glycerophosphodiester phosphodiesterase, partial [Saprospiraceae bacterium]|nr:glycerophosphodiester phosphodiesterase [Saprospiraceae bacterium]